MSSLRQKEVRRNMNVRSGKLATVLVTAAVALSSCALAANSTATKTGKKPAGGSVIPHVANSASPILSSSQIFTFAVESLTPDFPIDDMPQGHNPWTLRAKVINVYKGELNEKEKLAFETHISIYEGSVRSHPGGLWFALSPDPSSYPQPGQTWIAMCQSISATPRDRRLRQKLFRQDSAVASLLGILLLL